MCQQRDEHYKRLAFRLGHQSSIDDTVEQLRQQLDAERSQRAFDAAEFERQIASLLKDLVQTKYELARAKAALALALSPSASEMKH